jgi:hypothetical protein
MDRGRVGEDRGSKETDGCPLTKAARELQKDKGKGTVKSTE